MLRNEDVIEYKVEATTREEMIFDAKIRLAGEVKPSIQISNSKQLESFCKDLIENSAVEEMHLICVNCRCQVVAESMISTGDLSSCNAYPRKIAQVALLSNAYGVFLTHNHPGGTCAPSNEDITSTLQIQRALKQFDIMVIDHLIVTSEGKTYSMKQHGDF